MTLTLDTLVDRIRAASTLEELTQLVGPSDDDLVAERLRAMAIEQLRRHHGPDMASWPEPCARELPAHVRTAGRSRAALRQAGRIVGLTPAVVWPVRNAKGSVWFVAFRPDDAAKLARYVVPGWHGQRVQGAWPM